MKILIIQEAGRHEKNKDFRESLNLHRALLRIEFVESIVWGINYPSFQTQFSDLEKWCDVILILENYTSSWLPISEISQSRKLKIFWSIDSHCIGEQHKDLSKKLNVDIVLHSVHGHGYFFDFAKTFWFPNAYPSDLIYPINNVEKKYDIGFCGNVNNRGMYLDYISKHFNLKKDIFVIGHDMVNSINEYKIHFNRNISTDINYRTFETLGCGTFLLTNKTPGLEELFNIGENIEIYDDNDLLDKIRFYLQNETQRNILVNKGLTHVQTHHTYDNRAIQFIEIIKKNI